MERFKTIPLETLTKNMYIVQAQLDIILKNQAIILATIRPEFPAQTYESMQLSVNEAVLQIRDHLLKQSESD